MVRIIIISCAAMAAASLPYRPIAEADIFVPRDRFPWRSMATENLSRSARKNKLAYGTTEDPVDAAIDSIPVSYRVAVLEELVEARGRSVFPWLTQNGLVITPNDDTVNEIIRNYSKHLLGNIYLEVELLSILLRFVFLQNPAGFGHQATAESLVERMREYANDTWNTQINFISPRICIDISETLQTSGRFRVDIPPTGV